MHIKKITDWIKNVSMHKQYKYMMLKIELAHTRHQTGTNEMLHVVLAYLYLIVFELYKFWKSYSVEQNSQQKTI